MVDPKISADKLKRLNDEVTEVIAKIHNELIKRIKSLKGDPEEVAMFIGFELGRDYFKGARIALDDKLLLSGTSAVRSALENSADMFYIFGDLSKKETRMKTYIESVQIFDQTMIETRLKMTIKEIIDRRPLNQMNKWTNSTIADRIAAAGGSITLSYDMMSYFSHPNPAAIIYIGRPNLLSGQLNIVHQANCVSALILSSLSVSHAGIQSVTFDDLHNISMEFELGLDFKSLENN